MSPAERVKTFKNQIIVREAAFHGERKILHYTHNTKYSHHELMIKKTEKLGELIQKESLLSDIDKAISEFMR